ncbi:MAG: TetR/AcrR family transcriptional regulator [Candidatus Marinimicrobia bacterium]|nr:TetR/AcrR family transcriptional regulator [Candidatus Neomarinimicrobiota bacterium]MBT3997458.1 TetR/AcrR family transcriptional regulator [Candidatus Neomarinimicrobiota bacterium]MBT4281648.1 TetR/AcrR family transcriptional regulator [Candidatus Neomarinimicrobiota bacterium]MBT4569222.1 TetR/AcrR family transcriptional regulator [Candidatus Neomarinimicrobiota bacterium]MBT4796067.1 TetR/AcrR family transcriptional regulator [Candidatus Neomarinimicrobiota bacterium]
MKKEDRINQILNCTSKLLGKKSLDAIRTAEIAKEAGISEGALFKYFKTKDELLTKIIESYIENSHPIIDESEITTVQEFRDFINDYLSSMIVINEKRIPYLRLLLQISMQGHPLAKQKYKNVMGGFWKITEDRIEYGKKHWGFNPDFNPSIQIRLLHLSVLMFLIEQEVFEAKKYDPYKLEEVKDIAIENFFIQLTQQ